MSLLKRISLLSFCAFPALCRAAVVLSVDINDPLDTPGDTAAGFVTYVMSDNTLSIAPYTVDLNPANGAALDDVHRTTPLTTGSLTLGALYRDSVFAAGDNTANFYRVGLDTVIGGLTPGKKYTITAWSYDSGSTGARTSDWSLLGLGGPVFAANNYTFDGATTPASDTANRFSVTAFADATGTLVLRGRPGVQSATAQVYLNGFTVDELAPAAMNATTVLALDFNDRSFAGATYTAAGFNEFILDGTTATQSSATRTYSGLTVTLAGSGVTVDDRERTGIPGNSGAFTDSLLMRDFIFASNGVAGTGLDVTVSGLTANTQYLLELWSYDNSSGATVRTSDWTVNGAFLWDDYGFNGANLPVTNNDYKMAGVFTTNASGQFVISGRVVANSPSVFIDALRVSSLAPAPIVNLGHPILSEFIAQNDNGITDEDGATSDWIEIWNTTAATLDLAGWRLTNDALLPAKWVFPAGVILPSQSRLRVWASGKNRTTNPGALHTNFAIDKAPGGYLAFAQPDGTIVTSFTNIPDQRSNVSYGLTGTVEPLTAGYFQTPTPLAPNGVQVPGFVADTTFDVKRGFYTTPQTVNIACTTPGATIYYTTDGSDPTTASSVVPPGGIAITTTTVLRAKAFAPPLAPSNTDTQSYIFKAHVQNQPAAPAGWPSTWGINSEVNSNDGAGDGTVPADYEMDPDVVNSTQPGYSVLDAMNALPAISITMNPADFLSTGTGIYSNPQNVGDTWEKACSFEFFEPNGNSVNSNCGIRVHGNSSRRPFRMQKHSFRLAFRSSYGDGKLDYKLFDDTTVKQFDKLVLHAFFTDGWGLVSWDPLRYRPDDSVYFRDPFMKKSYSAMGHANISGRYTHVFINGLYWGVYELGERFDDAYCADHFGGLSTDYDVVAPGETVYVRAGTTTSWDSLFTLINSADLTVPANYDAVAALLDLQNFADYYLLHIHGDSEDWPHHNCFAYRNRIAPGSKWKFITWDQEITFDPTLSVDRLGPTATNTTLDKTPGRLYQKLRASAEFRLLLADRFNKHFRNNGAMTLAAEQARWQGFITLLDKGIVAESARWGDTADATPYGTAVTAGRVLKRETDWLPSVAAVKDTHFANLHNASLAVSTVAKLRAQTPRLYPLTEAPEFSQFGGNVASGFNLAMSSAAEPIYYTLNGTDPRAAYTDAVAGTLYTGPVALTATGTVKARILNAGEWSALTEATFIVGTAAASGNLAVTEINYNPALVSDEEFIELTNYSAGVIDLTGVHFEGITFTMPDATLLAAGERIVIARNLTAFTARYGSGPRVFGPFTGALDNTGEEIAVIAANGADIVRFSYNDKAPWPTSADGVGRSIVFRAPTLDPSIAANWRSSIADGGSPGTSDSLPVFTGTPLADTDGDGFSALIEHALGSSDASNASRPAPTAVVENVSIGGLLYPYLTISTTVRLGADDIAVSAEWSTDLTSWNPAVLLSESVALDGSVTRKWRGLTPSNTLGQPRQFLRIKAVK